MRPAAILVFTVLLGALLAQDAAAQWNVARFDTDRSRLYAAFGLDPALVTTLGYARVIGIGGHDVQLAADAGVVAFRMDAKDFRAQLRTVTSLAHWRSLHFTGAATFITRGTENSVYRGLNLGADLTGALGVYRRGWFAALEGGLDKAIMTHITHTDWYRDNFYADAKDGWYRNTGGIVHLGFAGGLAVKGAEVVARFGIRRTEELDDLVPPFYVNLAVGIGP